MRPMRAAWRARPADRSTTSFSRAKRSEMTSGGTNWSGVSAARVPGRGEKMKGEGAVVTGLGDERQRLFEVGVGFAGKTDDHVGRHRQIVDRRPRRRVAPSSARRCAAASQRAHGRFRTAAEGGAARRPRRSRPSPRSSRRRSFGCGLVKRIRADAVDGADRPQKIGKESPACGFASHPALTDESRRAGRVKFALRATSVRSRP